MAAVDFKIKNIKAADGTSATLAEVIGSIDASSIGQFQSIMDKLVERGVANLILDCSHVKYINSTGLGTLLKYVDTFENAGGHMSFVRVSAKVMLVMEMLGFNALFDIQEDEAAALSNMAGAAPAAPEATPAAVSAPAPSPIASPQPAALPTPAPSPVVAQSPAAPGPPPVAPAPSPAAPPPLAAAPALDQLPGVSFPLQIECTRCRVTLEVQTGGKFKCPRCETILQVEPNGRVRFFASKKLKPVQLVLPTHSTIVDGVGSLVSSVAKHVGFNGASLEKLATSITRLSRELIAAVYGDDPSRIFHMIIIPERGQVTVRVSDHGTPLDLAGGSLQNDPRFEEALRGMDMVSHELGERGGNVITVTKRVE